MRYHVELLTDEGWFPVQTSEGRVYVYGTEDDAWEMAKTFYPDLLREERLGAPQRVRVRSFVTSNPEANDG